ncbi:hypothetical protein [Carboxydothermus pertinax]|uniref:Uncharacterized protein n=1 Tax=Carboxydothermus pertinax TaxID=870242 RepID=A0A1L8CVR8_9THEO|nr:hypothetical protein [Carboxydothermus pertinax]GAV23003.1 hypothetical protein cpu_15130 [Carboxydothermus pertinax]
MSLKFNEIIGFYPYLKPGVGEGTMVITKDGREIFQAKSIKSFRREVLWYYFVDFKALRSQAKNLGEPVPLIVGRRIFVPFKFRKRLFPGDFCYAYFSLDEIMFCGGKKAMLRLNCGKSFYLACSTKTATSSLIRAKVLRQEISLRE